MNAARTLIYSALYLIGSSPGLAAGTLTLNHARQQLPNSLEWQSADLSFAAVGQNLNAARAATGLSVTVGGDAQAGVVVIGSSATSTSTKVTAGTTAASFSVSTSASLALLPWSAAFDGVRTATRAYDRAALDLRDTRNTLAINLTQLYQNARVAQLDLNNARSSERVAAQQLAVATKQQQNGQLSHDSLENTRRLLENAKLTTRQAIQNLELSRTQLFNAFGATDAGETLEPPTPAISATTPLEPLIQTALTQRVDVLKAISRVGDAEDALNVATRNRLLPSGSVGVSFGQGSGGTNLASNLGIATGNLSVSASTPLTGSNPTATNPTATSLTVWLSANVAVFDPNADAKVRSASLSLDAARKSVESTRQAAALDVRQKHADALLQRQRYTYQQQVLDNASSAVETANQRLALGSITALEVAQAQLTVSQARRDLENQLGTLNLSINKLENAIGNDKGESP
jgi:outer membrane protein